MLAGGLMIGIFCDLTVVSLSSLIITNVIKNLYIYSWICYQYKNIDNFSIICLSAVCLKKPTATKKLSVKREKMFTTLNLKDEREGEIHENKVCNINLHLHIAIINTSHHHYDENTSYFKLMLTISSQVHSPLNGYTLSSVFSC